MEDDDEFGDLYTDVLRPFTTASESLQLLNYTITASTTTTTSFQSSRPIDLNVDSDDEEILHGASNSKSNFNPMNSNNSNNNTNNNESNSFMQQKTLADSQPELENRPDPKGSISDPVLNKGVEKIEDLAGGGERGGELDLGARVLDRSEDRKSQKVAFWGSNLMDEGDINVVVDEREEKDDVLVEKDENLAGGNEKLRVEEGEPMIPGLSSSIPGISVGIQDRGDENFDEEYDSDSEDDLQIVLNNDNELGPMGMGIMGGMGGGEDDEDDEDGEPLVIVADNDNLGHQPMMEDQEWGEEGGADGERKELGDLAKVNGGVALPPKVGPYNSQPYHHPFHSQFKYVRPGVAPMHGTAPPGPGGTPGQVRPPVNLGPVAGRGRGDWRPAGRGGLLMQKGFGFGMPACNTAGRGLDFTLPSHKTIFEVDIDSFEEKPWRLPGIDISDFFNFGLNEESWKEYCKQLEHHRLETTMQSRIRVYESGRTEQEYDPDLPPELAAASGIQHISSENANVVKTDGGQVDLSRGLARGRPPLPTGRPIQVETNYTDRLPSIDTRQPRIRDSDAIIEIVCQESADDENEMVKPQDNEILREDLRESEETEDLSEEERISDAYNTRKRELVGIKTEVINPSHDIMAEGDETFPSEASAQRPRGSREQNPIYSKSSEAHEERTLKGKIWDRSPKLTTSGGTRDEQLVHNRKDEESFESIDDKSLLLSRGTVGAAAEEDVEDKVTLSDEFVEADRSFNLEREGMAVDTTPTQEDMLQDENLMPSSKKQKLNSGLEQPSPEIDDGEEESKAARSSENSKARSGSSKDYRKSRDGVGEEVVQGGRSMHVANIKRPSGRDEDIIRRKGRDERQETDSHRTSVKGREDSYSRQGWDPNSANNSRVKTNIPDRRREIDNAERGWQRIDEDLHGRRARLEDTRKEDHADEIGSRHQSNMRESERRQRDEHHQLKEHLDNGTWRGNHDKDMGPKHREDSLKNREESIDNLHSKRRKEEALLRREQAEREGILLGHRENSSRRKRKRDDIPDQRRRDDQGRLRDNDLYDARHKEEGLFQRERGERPRDRDEWNRPKHPQEENLSKRERDEGRGGLKSVRPSEEKTWTSHSRGKEEYRGSDREYHLKDVGRNSEQPKRRGRVENESLSQHKGREDVPAWGNHGNDERRARHERTSTHDDCAANDTDNFRVHEKKHKELIRKGKDSEGGDQNSIALPRRNHVQHTGQISEMGSSKGKFEKRSNENEARVKHQPSKHCEEASSDDEQPQSRRGLTKLERWASHKEGDFAMSTKSSSSSLQIKESTAGPSPSSKLPDKPSKTVEPKERPSAKDRDVPEDVKMGENKHLDTVEKLKKRSERFKQPLPTEKETTTTKKIEKESLPPAHNEIISPDTVIKSERPARKRRWTNT